MKRNFLLVTTAVAASLAFAGCATRTTSANRTIPPGPTFTGAPAGIIPAGTDLVIRTDAPISSNRAEPGMIYPATVARAVVDKNGNVVVPNGSPAELTVLAATPGGTFRSGDLAIALRSVTINGQRHRVRSQAFEQQNQGLGANRRTAAFVGGGAVLGTLIGAVAGGGLGAGVGALAGAGAGTATQVLTRGSQIRVPAEELLTFRLETPIRLE